MYPPEPISEVLARLAQSRFRSRFKLGPRERKMMSDKGLQQVIAEARTLLGTRLAPAFPLHDGKQTPMRGHPIFIAQHATATCCRSCLAKWHGIAKGNALSEQELERVLTVIEGWIVAQNVPMDGEPGLFG